MVKSFLGMDEPNPVDMIPGVADSPFLITCDHGGCYIPSHCNNLGLDEDQAQAHIAWDIGAAGVAKELSRLLGATLISQNYSRLLIDCNRQPTVSSSIPEISDFTTIPGNLRLSAEQRKARQIAIFDPYHQAIAGQLDQRMVNNQQTILVSVHSFTPIFMGEQRQLDLGILFNRDPRLGQLLLAQITQETSLRVQENAPYAVSDATDYTIPQHGELRAVPHVMLEIRNALIAQTSQQLQWAGDLADWLKVSVCLLDMPQEPNRVSASRWGKQVG